MKVWSGWRLAALILLLAACAPSAPRESLRNADASYQAVIAASNPLLSGLSVAERRNFAARWNDRNSLRDGDLAVSIDFDPERACYYSPSCDPTLTRSIRRGLTVTGDYFKLLTMLAEGANVDETQAQIGVLATSLAGLATIATGGAAVPLVGVVQALQPLIGQWARTRDMEELRRLVLEGAPKVDALLAELQAASKEVHETLIALPAKNAEGALFDNRVARRAALLQIREANITVANYVQLLGGLREALGALAGAVRNPGSELALASVADSSANLLIQTQAAARAIEILRVSGGTP